MIQLNNLIKSVYNTFSSYVFLVCCICSLGFSGQAEQFYVREHLVIDLYTGTEWMRCSVGQRWNGETCIGKNVNLNHNQMDEVISIATEQLGQGWRLPNRKELESLVCKHCGVPKIDKEIFPNTDPVPYWTGEQNKYAKKHYWSVNFYTGNTYGRFFPYQNLAVRLVRDR